MKSKVNLLLLGMLFIFSAVLAGCNAEKDAAQRKNLMMPKKSEMMRNERYKEVANRKTNKVKLDKAKRKKLY